MDRICINCKHLLKSWHTEPCKSCSGSGVSKKDLGLKQGTKTLTEVKRNEQ